VTPTFAVYPHRRFLSPEVTVFVEAMRAAFGDGSYDPWWPAKTAKLSSTRRSPRNYTGANAAVRTGSR
jgi:hypothetical protein